ncbi:MAG: hypothetical protein GPJ17_23230 [Microcystis aeruginosa K13-07]|nr:hypothetical protein [Microcystis aeruginosa K13-07]
MFYPEITSIIDDSFQSRFTYALKTFNPIVTVCPLKLMKSLHSDFVQLLYENNYKLVESEKNIDDPILKNCKIYVKD